MPSWALLLVFAQDNSLLTERYQVNGSEMEDQAKGCRSGKMRLVFSELLLTAFTNAVGNRGVLLLGRVLALLIKGLGSGI